MPRRPRRSRAAGPRRRWWRPPARSCRRRRLSTLRSTMTAYTKVATKTPSEALRLSRSRRNVRSTRGENWLLVSCSTTMVIEKTRPVKVIIDVVMADSTSRAPSGPAPKVQPPAEAVVAAGGRARRGRGPAAARPPRRPRATPRSRSARTREGPGACSRQVLPSADPVEQLLVHAHVAREHRQVPGGLHDHGAHVASSQHAGLPQRRPHLARGSPRPAAGPPPRGGVRPSAAAGGCPPRHPAARGVAARQRPHCSAYSRLSTSSPLDRGVLPNAVEATAEPTATVAATSKLDIFASERTPASRVSAMTAT